MFQLQQLWYSIFCTHITHWGSRLQWSLVYLPEVTLNKTLNEFQVIFREIRCERTHDMSDLHRTETQYIIPARLYPETNRDSKESSMFWSSDRLITVEYFLLRTARWSPVSITVRCLHRIMKYIFSVSYSLAWTPVIQECKQTREFKESTDLLHRS